MASIIFGYNYDIFISYRQKDNKYDGRVTEFIDTFKNEHDPCVVYLLIWWTAGLSPFSGDCQEDESALQIIKVNNHSPNFHLEYVKKAVSDKK